MDKSKQKIQKNKLLTQNFWSKKILKIWEFVLDKKIILISFTIGTLSLAFFTSTAYPNLRSDLGIQSIRTFGFGVGLIIINFVFLATLWCGFNLTQIVIKWLTIISFVFYSFVYFLTIENENLLLPAMLILTVLITWFTYDLFGKSQFPLLLLVSQVLLVTLQTFSLIRFLVEDNTQFRKFDNSFLQDLGGLDSFWWLLVGTIAVTGLSLVSLNLKKIRSIFISGSLFFLFFFQGFILVDALKIDTLTYWQQVLLFIIFWDFIYTPLKIVSKEIIDSKYYQRMTVSVIYHFLLFGAVFYLNSISSSLNSLINN